MGQEFPKEKKARGITMKESFYKKIKLGIHPFRDALLASFAKYSCRDTSDIVGRNKGERWRFTNKVMHLKLRVYYLRMNNTLT